MLFHWIASAVADPLLLGSKLLLIGGLLGLVATLINARCQLLIAQWASRGGWDLIGCRRCFFGARPFGFLPGMPIYRVELKNRSGRQREAYVRCGDLTWSILSDALAVEWVEADGR